MSTESFLKKLQSRGALHDASNFAELESLLGKEQISFYCGFDPTADSLHAGSMLPLIIMNRLQQAGHTPIVLLGSATGMIGDPSGKSEERKLLDEETLRRNVAGIEKQIRLFLSADGPNAFRIVKNGEWLDRVGYIEFLRDVGKHFSVNAMIAKDSVKNRLENREQGISYTEFSYMLLQAYDFYFLNHNHGCRLQVGGSDQWGNITAGLELIRRKSADGHPSAYGLTFPLLTTASGSKFGKTEQGAIWLDGTKTSPYSFYQYWLNSADADVVKYLLLFTPVEGDELEELKKAVAEHPERRSAQQYLAQYLTTLVHGKAETVRSVQASRILFGESFANVDSQTLLEVFRDVPSTSLSVDELGVGVQLQDLLVRCGLAQSKGAARRAVDGGGVYVNNERVTDATTAIGSQSFVDGAVLVLRSGKKNYHLVRIQAAS
ncbi:MAG: tyrosine--tRNA ligase [Bdellovibrionota bacterium]